ncbi:hypothetical protein BJ508DRAFT_311676 [Ascobolus immersus RN42]|uniref:Uncharacterized protein n=1 Tax=Ascobolus immersus RN42 TaxID=1160509 RepID=A0A3N4HTC2_ASCIM|nr:hypothetical protein BJ508DRAFT_311676 [Ascobolus immersus RN42]
MAVHADQARINSGHQNMSIIYTAARLATCSLTAISRAQVLKASRTFIHRGGSKERVQEGLRKPRFSQKHELSMWMRRMVATVYDCLVSIVDESLSTRYDSNTLEEAIQEEMTRMAEIGHGFHTWRHEGSKAIEVLKESPHIAPVLSVIASLSAGFPEFTLSAFLDLQELSDASYEYRPFCFIVEQMPAEEDWLILSGHFGGEKQEGVCNALSSRLFMGHDTTLPTVQPSGSNDERRWVASSS